jgi:hypothetical protein
MSLVVEALGQVVLSNDVAMARSQVTGAMRVPMQPLPGRSVVATGSCPAFP